MMLDNESTQRSPIATYGAIESIADAMLGCIERGLAQEGPLPGPLKVRRRAKGLLKRASAAKRADPRSGLHAMYYVSAFARRKYAYERSRQRCQADFVVKISTNPT
jgi:L-serine dehydratase